MNHKRLLVIVGVLLIAVLALAACEAEPVEVEVTREVEVEVTREVQVEVEVPGPEVEVTRVVEVMVEPEMAVDVIPFEEMWASSPHNDKEAEAFIHWDEDDPAEVSTSCAKCHSTPGYLDFLGADGTEAGVVDNAAPIGTTVECAACHNAVTVEKTSVVFPSGIEITDLGDESRCMECHQGRQSTVSVNARIEEAGVGPDELSEDLGFANIHYYPAAATLYGTAAKGGYEYEGKMYDAKFDHIAGYDTCIACHDPHTLEVKIDECTACHTDVTSADDLVNVRMPGSLVDYDGDGDMSEGIAFEIEGFQEALYAAIQAYGTDVAGTGIMYDSSSYPYFFTEDGERFASWTPRLMQATYNYQVSQKDPGKFAHGGKYIIQLLYDSIESLNEVISTPVDMSAMNRLDHGHFAGSEEAFRHWDGEEDGGIVSGRCSKCHSAAGLPLFAEQGVTINQPAANGLNCATCHSSLEDYTLYEFEDVTFPSGATVTLGEPGPNLCINCHQGRASGQSVAGAINGLDEDVAADSLRFINIHYFAAGATLFGSEVNGMYEFPGNLYAGRNEHVGAFDTCVECHDVHALEVEVEGCANCHEGVETAADLHNIRISETDFDGDGDAAEGLAGEIETMAELLYTAMQDYSGATLGNTIVYDSHSYPYFFTEAGERYSGFSPRLVKATYNYQYALKDPGAYAHNGKYVIQVLYDSLVDIGADVSGMTRPD